METENRKESFNDIIRGNKPVLVDFSAAWCGPCKMMEPVLRELRQRMDDQIRILKIDIDKTREMADAFGIQAVPTLILIKNGDILWRRSGVVQAVELEKIIKQLSLSPKNE